jgi:hypothetical protein
MDRLQVRELPVVSWAAARESKQKRTSAAKQGKHSNARGKEYATYMLSANASMP